MEANHSSSKRYRGKKRFVSLRLKLLIAFTLAFVVVFAVSFFWFFEFATQQAMSRIQEDLRHTVEAAAKGVDAAELVALAHEAQPNDEGFTDDPRYQRQLDWLQIVHNIEPRAWPYNYVVGDDEAPVIYIADLWYRYDKSKAVLFLEPRYSKGFSYRGFSDLTFRTGYRWEDWWDQRCEQGMAERFAGWCEDNTTFPLAYITKTGFNTYTDEWGRWVSAYAPVMLDGEVVGAVGVDFEADYVDQVQQGIGRKVLAASGVAYLTFLTIIYLASGAFTQPIRHLTTSAQAIGEGDYNQNLSSLINPRLPDEIDTLAQVFQLMIGKVRQREQEAHELQIKAEESSRLKSEFLAITSHELRTPLNSIIGFTECILSGFGVIGPGLSNDQRYLLERVRDNSKRLLVNINDLLDMSQLEARRIEPTNERFSVGEMVNRIVRNIASQATAKGLSISTEIDADMPDSIIGDAHLITRIVTNLVANAIKFTKFGQIDIVVRMHGTDHWQIAVTDTGIGIPADRLGVIFEPFRQVDGSTRRIYGGTGLGLAIARDHARLMSGRVEVESTIGTGSTFTLILPLHCAPEETTIAASTLTQNLS